MAHFETLNVGEWSEFYTFLKVLLDKKLSGCNSGLEVVLNENCSVVGVEKKQQRTNINLFYSIGDGCIEIYSKNQILKKIPITSFEKCAEKVLLEIEKNKKRTFQIEKIDDFLNVILNPKIKASSHEKKDITITIKEPLTQSNQTYGFSVKSNLSKAPSTLLNASLATNFTFLVNDKIDKTSLKAKKLLKNITNIEFKNLESDIFYNNLQMIDTQFHIILSWIVLYYYQGKGRMVKDLLPILEKENPLKLKDVSIYRLKIEKFLLVSALGMVPNTKWNGLYDADGGLLIVKKSGEIVSFHIFNQKLLNELKMYLVNNAYLDTPSTTRHKFGVLYCNGDQQEVKLNLQIRLIP